MCLLSCVDRTYNTFIHSWIIISAEARSSSFSPKHPNQLSFPLNFLFNGYQGCVVSGFRHKVGKNCGILGYRAVSSGNFLPMFRDNLSVPSLGVNQSHLHELQGS